MEYAVGYSVLVKAARMIYCLKFILTFAVGKYIIPQSDCHKNQVYTRDGIDDIFRKKGIYNDYNKTDK